MGAGAKGLEKSLLGADTSFSSSTVAISDMIPAKLYDIVQQLGRICLRSVKGGHKCILLIQFYFANLCMTFF